VYRTSDVETSALNSIDLAIEEGEFVAIMGPSGCGKSTLLNILGMLDAPTSGSYRFLGQEVAGNSEGQLARLRKEHIGFVFQSFNLIDELTVERNIALALIYHQIPRAERKQRTLSAMERMGIAHRRTHRPSELSGGQQQRVAVARALISDPKVVLADEPTGNLDSSHGEEVMTLLAELNNQGRTVIMVTHSEEYARCAQRVIHLLDGAVTDMNPSTSNVIRDPGV
jgi:putative ABC transport system ATP-binding protein